MRWADHDKNVGTKIANSFLTMLKTRQPGPDNVNKPFRHQQLYHINPNYQPFSETLLFDHSAGNGILNCRVTSLFV